MPTSKRLGVPRRRPPKHHQITCESNSLRCATAQLECPTVPRPLIRGIHFSECSPNFRLPLRFTCVTTSITQKSGKKATRPKGGGGQAAPPERRQRKGVPLKGRRRDHHSTELNLTSVNLKRSQLLFLLFLVKK